MSNEGEPLPSDQDLNTGQIFARDQIITTLCEELGWDKLDLTPEQELELEGMSGWTITSPQNPDQL